MSRKNDDDIYEDRKHMDIFSDEDEECMNEDDAEIEDEEDDFEDIYNMKNILNKYSKDMALPLCEYLTFDCFYEN